MLVSPESIGHHLLAAAQQLHRLRPRPSDIAAALRIRIKMDVPAGCHGWYDAHTHTIHIEWTCDPDEYEKLVRHELAHLGMTEFGVPYDEQEENARDVELTLDVPTNSARRLWRRHGFFPQMFVNFYGRLAVPSDILQRAARACDVAAIIHSSVGHIIPVGCDHHEVNLLLSPQEQRALVKAAKRRAKSIEDIEDIEKMKRAVLPSVFGVQARPYRYGHLGHGVVIFFDLDHALTMDDDWERLAAQ